MLRSKINISKNNIMVPDIIFLIPYRDREEQKKVFQEKMEITISKYDKTCELYYCFQNDERNFNRGALKNIGFLAMKEKYPDHYQNITFVFNDIDTFPRESHDLDYATEKNIVKHFFGFTYALGGIVSIKGSDFELVLGYPNFWGWGFEDNLIQDRCTKAGLKIDRSCFFKINDKKNIDHSFDGWTRTLSKRDQYVYSTESPDDMYKLKDVKWSIEGQMINITNFTPEMLLEDQEFYKRDIRHGTRVRGKPGYFRKNWNMGNIMKR